MPTPNAKRKMTTAVIRHDSGTAMKQVRGVIGTWMPEMDDWMVSKMGSVRRPSMSPTTISPKNRIGLGLVILLDQLDFPALPTNRVHHMPFGHRKHKQ